MSIFYNDVLPVRRMSADDEPTEIAAAPFSSSHPLLAVLQCCRSRWSIVIVTFSLLPAANATLQNPFSSFFGRSIFESGRDTYTCATSSASLLPVFFTLKVTRTSPLPSFFTDKSEYSKVE